VSSKLARGIGRVRHLGNRRDLENYRDLLAVLLQKELKVRYNNKALGYLWSVANPLASAMVYYIAFKFLMRFDIPDYPLVLISGIFPWQWFSNAVGSSPNLFVANASIIKKLSFPRNIIPLCAVLNHMIHFVASMPVIFLFLFLFKRSPDVTWLYGFPLLLVISLMMIYGISLILSSINLFFRDLERLTTIILNFTFYFTPILYPIEQIPEGYRKYIALNPAAPIIVSWRELILYNRLEPVYLLISAAYAVVFFAIGYSIYRRLSWKFAEVI
jgi:lipopolysaccharide transport system permease protein